ncbi:MAG: hypothetical protein PHY48_16145 [Candidatus Cloacimonetes bacterium]|nr:hypothetical protein [Candidatus Cloacimonadota bacterium]
MIQVGELVDVNLILLISAFTFIVVILFHRAWVPKIMTIGGLGAILVVGMVWLFPDLVKNLNPILRYSASGIILAICALGLTRAVWRILGATCSACFWVVAALLIAGGNLSIQQPTILDSAWNASTGWLRQSGLLSTVGLELASYDTIEDWQFLETAGDLSGVDLSQDT